MFGYHQAAPHFQQHYPRRAAHHQYQHPYASHQAARSPSPHAQGRSDFTLDDLLRSVAAASASPYPPVEDPQRHVQIQLPTSCGLQAFKPAIATATRRPTPTTPATTLYDGTNLDSDSDFPTLEQYEIFDAVRRRKELQELEERQARRRAEEERFLAAQVEARARAQAQARARARAAAEAKARAEAEAAAAAAEEARRAAYVEYLQRQRAEARARIQAQAERAAAAAAATSQQEQRKKAFFARIFEQVQRQAEAEANAQAQAQAEKEANARAQKAQAEENAAKKAFKQEQEAAQRLVEEWKKEQQEKGQSTSNASAAAQEPKKQPTEKTSTPEYSPEDIAKIFLAQLGLIPSFQQQAKTTEVKEKGKGKATSSGAPVPTSSAAPDNASSSSTSSGTKVRFAASSEGKVDGPTPAEIQAAVGTSLKALDALKGRFETLKEAFVEPELLIFEASDATNTASDLPALAFAPVNRSIKEYEETLTRLLTQLDEVESHGSEQVKKMRKELAVSIQSELDRIDAIKIKHWSAQHPQAELTAQHAAAAAAGETGVAAVEETKESAPVEAQIQIEADDVQVANTSDAEEATSAPAATDAEGTQEDTATAGITEVTVETPSTSTADDNASTEPAADTPAPDIELVEADIVDEHIEAADNAEHAEESPVAIQSADAAKVASEDMNVDETTSSELGAEVIAPEERPSTETQDPQPALEDDSEQPKSSAQPSGGILASSIQETVSTATPQEIDSAKSELAEDQSEQNLPTASSSAHSPLAGEVEGPNTNSNAAADETVLFEVESVSDGGSVNSDVASQHEGEHSGNAKITEHPEVPLQNKSTTVSDEEDDDLDAEVKSDTSFEWIE